MPFPVRLSLKTALITLLAGFAPMAFSAPAELPSPTIQQKIENPDEGYFSMFRLGAAVAIDGDTMVVGASETTVAGQPNAGTIQVFVRDAQGAWSRQIALAASDFAANREFGRSVAIDGDTIVVGTSSVTEADVVRPGEAYVFTRSGTDWNEQAKLQPAEPLEAGLLGATVAISGDTAVVGLSGGTGDRMGAVIVYTRTGAAWGEQARFQGSASGEDYGSTIALSGDTLVVGARWADDGLGWAYVYTGDGAHWALQAKLRAADTVAGDTFGHSVAISGDTIAVGASQAAYVFARSGAAWTEQAKLSGADVSSSPEFAGRVAIELDTLVVGDNESGPPSDSGAAHVYTRSGSSWSWQAKLTAAYPESDAAFGRVAISGGTIAVGAPGAGDRHGAAYAFVRAGEGWSCQAALTDTQVAQSDFFGGWVSVQGQTAVIGVPEDSFDGAYRAGSVSVFTRSESGWAHEAKLTADDMQPGSGFGYTTAMTSDTIVVGALHSDEAGLSWAGAAYVFTRHDATTWTQQARLVASDGAANDLFGSALAIDGDTLVVSSPGDDDVAEDAGSVTVFTREGSGWAEQATLTAPEATAKLGFGTSVALSGDTLVVGCGGDLATQSGANVAYVFIRNGSTWTQQAKLTAADSVPSDMFGFTVAIDGDTILVGAFLDDYAGSVYAFTRQSTTWTQQAKLTASDRAIPDFFGSTIALQGDRALIGAGRDDTVATDSGSAYLFVREGATWIEQTKLIAEDAASADVFGCAVAMDRDVAIIGAAMKDDPEPDSGAAYAFEFVPLISGFSVNGGEQATADRLVTLGAAISGDPTGCMISESPDFSGAQWQPFAGDLAWTLSQGLGEKTVYFKIRNTLHESAVVSDTITLSAPNAATHWQRYQ